MDRYASPSPLPPLILHHHPANHLRPKPIATQPPRQNILFREERSGGQKGKRVRERRESETEKRREKREKGRNMVKRKKGNLKAALATHERSKQVKVKQKAIQEANQRKQDSISRSSSSRPKPSVQNRRKEEGEEQVDRDPKDEGGEEQKSGEGGDEQDPDKGRRGGKKTWVQPFNKKDSILIVGEANFSFTLSLLLPPRSHPPGQILATAYDSEEECYQKYPDARSNVSKIRELANGRSNVVVFGVDAGRLDRCKEVSGRYGRGKDGGVGRARWSKVWFGFPHVGAGHKDETRNILANQLLLIRFFISVAPFLTEGKKPEYAIKAAENVNGKTGKKRKNSDSEDEEEVERDGEEVAVEEGEEEDEFSIEKYRDSINRGGTDGGGGGANSENWSPIPPPVRGSVLVTLRNASPYTRWNLTLLAKKLSQVLPSIVESAPSLPKGQTKPTLQMVHEAGLKVESKDFKPAPPKLKPRERDSGYGRRLARLPSPSHEFNTFQNGDDPLSQVESKTYSLWRSFEFDPTEWKGYEHRRTIGWIEGVSKGNNQDLLRSRSTSSLTDPFQRASKAGNGECRTWEFGLD
ncbi:hypothetical protein IE53DRAFT_390174 [Violaceomyces palustris]|uniref:Uncharacterized protein n=1 Tax=Violaceomyces palustris TaxID=1673888 RepID=A0ACD0NPL1_9BASI|nr:hypothetical protein IE53DRAFT_390174 [Violaceomyces palustris]